MDIYITSALFLILCVCVCVGGGGGGGGGGKEPESQICKFQIQVNDTYLKYFLWHCYQMNATTLHWSLVDIGSGNGLVPSGNKPLPEPMLSYRRRVLIFSIQNYMKYLYSIIYNRFSMRHC